MNKCLDCGDTFDLSEGGFIWDGDTFCELCDPEEVKL
jgi:hypothetical protein